MHRKAALLWLASLAAPAPAASPEPPRLTPSGKWVLDYGEEACTLSRPMGSGQDALTFIIRQWPSAEDGEFVIFTPAKGSVEPRIVEGRVQIGSDKPVAGDVITYTAGAPMRRIFIFQAPRIDALDTAAPLPITLMPALGKPFRLTLTNLKAALAAAIPCKNDLMQSWGLDPAIERKVATPAQPLTSPARWLVSDDYPKAALRNSNYGNTRILLSIGVNGMITACRVLSRSGTPAIDAAACEVVSKRARYHPARDAAGMPVPSYKTFKVSFRLP